MIAPLNKLPAAIDPLRLAKRFWPDVKFYPKQEEIIYSVLHDDETVVPAGNMLGKDFVAGFLAIAMFLANPVCRIVITSVNDRHLRVLWGEMMRFINTSKEPLRVEDGGPLIVNDREICKLKPPMSNEEKCPISYLIRAVSAKGEGMSGHHAPYTLAIFDEASGLDDNVYTMCDAWAKRKLIIGNPHPCNNFFYKAVKEGDVIA